MRRIIQNVPANAPPREIKNISREERKRISDFLTPWMRKIPNSCPLNRIKRVEVVARRMILIKSTEKAMM